MSNATLSSSYVQGQLHLLQSGVFSDFKILCQDHVFNVHRALISPGSTYFSKVCADGFAFQEGPERQVNLSEDDPAIISRVLLYLYTRSYDVESLPTICNNRRVPETQATMKETTASNETLSSSGIESSEGKSYLTANGLDLTLEQAHRHLIVHTEVYACADRLGISELKDHAHGNFIDIASDAYMRIYHKASFAEVLNLVYENTVLERKEADEMSPDRTIGCAKGLRYTATMCVIQHMKDRPDVPQIENSLNVHEPLAWEVARALEKEQSEHASTKGRMETYSAKVKELRQELDYAKEDVKATEEYAKELEEDAKAKGDDANAKEATQRVLLAKLGILPSCSWYDCENCPEKLHADSINIGDKVRGSRKITAQCRSCKHENSVAEQWV